MADFDPFAGRPKLSTWYHQVKQELSPFYHEAHKIVYTLVENKSKL